MNTALASEKLVENITIAQCRKDTYMEQMIDLLVNSGVAVAVIAYFCIRDWRFTDQISRTLSAIETLLKHEESEEDK